MYDKGLSTPTKLDVTVAKLMMLSELCILTVGVLLSLSRNARKTSCG